MLKVPEWATRLIYTSDGALLCDNGPPEWKPMLPAKIENGALSCINGYKIQRIGMAEELPTLRMPKGDWSIVRL